MVLIKMNKNSLEKAREIIVKSLFASNINASDRAELIIVLTSLLNENTYDKQVKTIRKVKYKK